MRMSFRHATALALVPGIVLLLTACGSTPPARFYTLSSLAVAGDARQPPGGARRQVVGIGPIAMAKYLDHAGIVTRGGPNTVTRSELDRWGGSLGDEVSRVLVENLGQLLADGDYLVLPWLETAASNLRVQLNVTRFDGPPEGPVVLNTAWLLFAGASTNPLASGNAVITEPLRGEGYAATAEAMSRALGALSRRIVAEIHAMAGAGG